MQRTWWVKVCHSDSRILASLSEFGEPLLQSRRSLPDVVLLILTCDVAQHAIDEWRGASAGRGISHAPVWGRTQVEDILYRERPDLLFSYFGLTSYRRWHRKVHAIRRRVQIKHRLLRDLLKLAGERPATADRPFEKFKHAKLVLRSIDDESYPQVETRIGVTRGWFEVGTYDFYHDGVEVIIGTADVAVDSEGRWTPIPAGFDFDSERFRVIRTIETGRVPYEMVVDCDPSGDEYYREPHLFCVFAAAGLPFAEYHYYPVEDPYRLRLLPEKMVEVDEASAGSARPGVVRAAVGRRTRRRDPG